MNTFTYNYPVRIYFGKGCADNAVKAELIKAGKNVMFAFGGGVSGSPKLGKFSWQP